MILSATLNPCIDKTVWVRRLELGGFVKADRIDMIAGGKGNNVARALKNLGHPVQALNVLGQIQGRVVKQALDAEGIANHAVWVAGPTREVITVVERDTYHQTAYFGPSAPVTLAEKADLLRAYEQLVQGCDLAVVSGSSPDETLDDVGREMILLGKRAGIRTVFDSRDRALQLGIAAIPFALKPNLAEAGTLFGAKVSGREDMWRALDQLETDGVELTVLSLGDQGALVRYHGITYEAIPPEVEVVNPVGSGDCMVAGICAGLVSGMEIQQTLRLATACAAANVAVWQAAAITQEQVAALLPKVHLRELDSPS